MGIPRIGQFVEIDELVLGIPRKKIPDEITPNEPIPTSNQDY